MITELVFQGVMTPAAAPIAAGAVGWVAAGASWTAAGTLMGVQRARVLAGVETKFSRGVLMVFALLMLTGIAALACLPSDPGRFMLFVAATAVTCLTALLRRSG